MNFVFGLLNNPMAVNAEKLLADTSFSEAMLEKYMDKAVDFGVSVLVALIIFFIGKYFIRFILKVTKRLFDKSSIDDAVGNFINSLLRVILYGVLIIIICDKVGIQTTSFIALLTSAGLAIGLTLVLVHLVCIRYTGTSVNPARSIAPAVFQGGTALSNLWIFIVGPFVGGALAAFCYKIFDCKKECNK